MAGNIDEKAPAYHWAADWEAGQAEGGRQGGPGYIHEKAYIRVSLRIS